MGRQGRIIGIIAAAVCCALLLIGAGAAENRALLIGEKDFIWFADEYDPEEDASNWWIEEALRNAGDTAVLGRTLDGVTGPDGKDFRIRKEINLSRDGIEAAIRETFADSREGDVSIFFIATHGYRLGDGDLRTAWSGKEEDLTKDQVKEYRETRWLDFRTLAKWLKKYTKGKVFVILESCGSGSAIYDEDEGENGLRPETGAAAAEAFVSRAEEAFREIEEGSEPASEGDLRQRRFYVLAASRHHEQSWGIDDDYEGKYYNFFTKWLTEGIGQDGEAPADRNGDGALTLEEMYEYVKQYQYMEVDGEKYWQHVQGYPKDSRTVLLKVKRKTPEPPKTGDGAEPVIWLLMMLAGLAGLAAAGISAGRRRRGR